MLRLSKHSETFFSDLLERSKCSSRSSRSNRIGIGKEQVCVIVFGAIFKFRNPYSDLNGLNVLNGLNGCYP
jgi:hypothetical protein